MPTTRKSEGQGTPSTNAERRKVVVSKPETKLETTIEQKIDPKRPTSSSKQDHDREDSPEVHKKSESPRLENKRPASIHGTDAVASKSPVPKSIQPPQSPSVKQLQTTQSPSGMRLRDRASQSPAPTTPGASGKMKQVSAEILKHGPQIRDKVLPSHVEPVVNRNVVVKSPCSPQPRSNLSPAPGTSSITSSADSPAKRKNMESPNILSKKAKSEEKPISMQKSPMPHEVQNKSPSWNIQPKTATLQPGLLAPGLSQSSNIQKQGSASPSQKFSPPNFSSLSSTHPPNSKGNHVPYLLSAPQQQHQQGSSSPKAFQSVQAAPAPQQTVGKSIEHGAPIKSKSIAPDAVAARAGSPSIAGQRDARAQK